MKNKLIAAMLVLSITATGIIGCGSSDAGTADEADQTQETVAEEEEAVAEEASNPEAQKYYDEGLSFLYGTDGNEINVEIAYSNFYQAKELGCTDANFYLGVLYDWYGYPQTDYEAAKTYYEACGENPYAQLGLGLLYLFGQGVEEDEAKANEIFQTLIDQGYVEGYLGIAYIARDAEDYTTALENFNKVLDGTEQVYLSSAMYNIGYMYDEGTGVELDDAKAIEWYEKAAEIGNASAMYNIGYMYEYGEGVEQNVTTALEWYEKAAVAGNSNAMNSVGYMYANGDGVEQDSVKAIEWYVKAAEAGNAIAMNNLGTMYYYGEGVEQNNDKALEWWDKAAELGNETAKTNAEYLRNNQ